MNTQGSYVGDYKVPIQCMTPPTLLENISVHADELDAVNIDVEGLEETVLSLLLETSDFSPSLIALDLFRMRQHSEEQYLQELERVNLVVQLLHARGYDVFQVGDSIVGATTVKSQSTPSMAKP